MREKRTYYTLTTIQDTVEYIKGTINNTEIGSCNNELISRALRVAYRSLLEVITIKNIDTEEKERDKEDLEDV